MTTYHVLPIVMPSDLLGVDNGEVPANLLRPLKGSPGQLHHEAATAFNCLQLAAYFAGIELKPVSPADTYRPYTAQQRLFKQRYSTTPTGRVPTVTRTWNKTKFYLKKGVAPAGVPGTSNHGWGLAVDISSASGARLAWMLGNDIWSSPVVQYGFSWEVKEGANAESWHIRYVCGDTPPAKVLEALEAFPDLKAV